MQHSNAGAGGERGPDASVVSPQTCAEHYVDDLEELLDDAILHDFNVEAQDGSPRQVCRAGAWQAAQGSAP